MEPYPSDLAADLECQIRHQSEVAKKAISDYKTMRARLGRVTNRQKELVERAVSQYIRLQKQLDELRARAAR